MLIIVKGSYRLSVLTSKSTEEGTFVWTNMETKHCIGNCTRINYPNYILRLNRLHFRSISDQNGGNIKPWSINPGSCFSRRVQQERADSPGPSCVSMKSDRSMDDPPGFKDGRPSSGGVVDITKLCLMEMNQEELADTLWGGKRLLFWNRAERDS